MKQTKFSFWQIIIEPCKEGGFFAKCPDLQGCYAEGETYDEVLENIQDVIQIHLDFLKEKGDIKKTFRQREKKFNIQMPIPAIC